MEHDLLTLSVITLFLLLTFSWLYYFFNLKKKNFNDGVFWQETRNADVPTLKTLLDAEKIKIKEKVKILYVSEPIQIGLLHEKNRLIVFEKENKEIFVVRDPFKYGKKYTIHQNDEKFIIRTLPAPQGECPNFRHSIFSNEKDPFYHSDYV